MEGEADGGGAWGVGVEEEDLVVFGILFMTSGAGAEDEKPAFGVEAGEVFVGPGVSGVEERRGRGAAACGGVAGADRVFHATGVVDPRDAGVVPRAGRAPDHLAAARKLFDRAGRGIEKRRGAARAAKRDEEAPVREVGKRHEHTGAEGFFAATQDRFLAGRVHASLGEDRSSGAHERDGGPAVAPAGLAGVRRHEPFLSGREVEHPGVPPLEVALRNPRFARAREGDARAVRGEARIGVREAGIRETARRGAGGVEDPEIVRTGAIRGPHDLSAEGGERGVPRVRFAAGRRGLRAGRGRGEAPALLRGA